MTRVPKLLVLVAAVTMALAVGCTHHTVKVEPIEVKPISIDVTIRVDRELDKFFDYEDELPPAPPPGATVPGAGAGQGALP